MTSSVEIQSKLTTVPSPAEVRFSRMFFDRSQAGSEVDVGNTRSHSSHTRDCHYRGCSSIGLIPEVDVGNTRSHSSHTRDCHYRGHSSIGLIPEVDVGNTRSHSSHTRDCRYRGRSFIGLMPLLS